MHTSSLGSSSSSGATPSSPSSEALWLAVQGFHPISYAAGTKAPKTSGWNKPARPLGITSDDFQRLFPDDSNLGVLTGDEYSAGLRDIDCDCPEAVHVARRFLPETKLVWGNNGAARHYGYIAKGLKSAKFSDPAVLVEVNGKKIQATLVELRGDGLQTMVPPSLHPKGTRVQWVSKGTPATADPEVLRAAVTRVAVAAVLARRYPGLGARHDFTLAVGAWFARLGIEIESAVEIILAAADAAGCSALDNKERAIRDSFAKVERDKDTWGLPKAIDINPDMEKTAGAVQKWLGVRNVAGVTVERAERPKSDKPQIITNDPKREDMDELHEETFAVIVRENTAKRSIFVRGIQLVRVRKDDDGQPILQAMTEGAVTGYLAKTIQWLSLEQRMAGRRPGGGPKLKEVYTPVNPPHSVVSNLMSRPDWTGIPIIRDIVRVPVFNRDGVLVTTPGYDDDTRLWYAPEPGFAATVPDNPTAGEVARATQWLLEMVQDFPFASNADRAHALALVFQPFVRELIGGPTPLYLFDSPVQGAGKGLLVDCAAIIATGARRRGVDAGQRRGAA
jgi:hypothetical protein